MWIENHEAVSRPAGTHTNNSTALLVRSFISSPYEAGGPLTRSYRSRLAHQNDAVELFAFRLVHIHHVQTMERLGAVEELFLRER